MDGSLGERAEVPRGSAVVTAQRLAPVQPGQRAVQQRWPAHLAPCSEKAQRKLLLHSLRHSDKPPEGSTRLYYLFSPSQSAQHVRGARQNTSNASPHSPLQIKI